MRLAAGLSLMLALFCGAGGCDGTSFLGRSRRKSTGGSSGAGDGSGGVYGASSGATHGAASVGEDGGSGRDGGGSGGKVGSAGEGGSGSGGDSGGSSGGTLGAGSGGSDDAAVCFSRFADGKLGSECAGAKDCEPGLECINADSRPLSPNGGPAKGYCTKPCNLYTYECAALGPRAYCYNLSQSSSDTGYCLEGCTSGNEGGATKCHGRSEVACLTEFWDNGTFCFNDDDCSSRGMVCSGRSGGTCGTVVCRPQCNSDADCGGALACNRKTGLCSAGPRTGLPIGERCDPLDDQCRGFCWPAGFTPELSYVCREGCTLGAVPACGWSGFSAGDAEALCMYSARSETLAPYCGSVEHDAALSFPSTGDYGACIKLCDCNLDCTVHGQICRELEGPVQRATGRRGYCSSSENANGGVDSGIVTCD
jgi:hypothetical protein